MPQYNPRRYYTEDSFKEPNPYYKRHHVLTSRQHVRPDKLPRGLMYSIDTTGNRDTGIQYPAQEDPEDTGLPTTDYKAEYERVRRYMRKSDKELLDLVLTSGLLQREIADRLGVTQGCIGHAYATAQHNLKELATRPPEEGVRRTLYREFEDYYLRHMHLVLWLYIKTTNQSAVARIMVKRRGWKKCKQCTIRRRIEHGVSYLRWQDTEETRRAADLLEWTFKHQNIMFEFAHLRRGKV